MDANGKIMQVKDNIKKVLVCKDETIELVLAAVLSRGHVLIEDVPGIGKTTLVRALSSSIGCTFQRIQFTPDLMPSDVTGFTMIDISTGELKFKKGAIMNQIVLADEINRTSPKTQSSLLEAMQEGQVTIDGNTYDMPKPFVVLATQNPIEHVGTFPLPEAQLDRFFIKLSLGYPGISDEISILNRHDGVPSPLDELEPVMTADEIVAMQDEVDKVVCADPIKEYIALIVGQTRTNSDLLLGASPRGAIALMRGAKAWAYIHGSEYVTPDDVIFMTPHVLAHRLILRPEAKLKDMTAVRVLKNITNVVRIPDSV